MFFLNQIQPILFTDVTFLTTEVLLSALLLYCVTFVLGLGYFLR